MANLSEDVGPKKKLDDEEEEKKRKREREKHQVLKELIDTEQKYFQSLEQFIEFYFQPLDKNMDTLHAVISEDQMQTLFGTLRLIHRFTSKFRAKLSDLADDPKQVAQVLKDWLMHMESCYHPYVVGIERSQSLLDRLLTENKAFKHFVETTRQQRVENQPPLQGVDSYLIMPFQRLTRYQLLLMRLLENTDAKDERSMLGEGLEHVKELAERCNASCHVTESRRNLRRIEKSLSRNKVDCQSLKCVLQGRLSFTQASSEAFLEGLKELFLSLFFTADSEIRNYYLFDNGLLVWEEGEAPPLPAAAPSDDAAPPPVGSAVVRGVKTESGSMIVQCEGKRLELVPLRAEDKTNWVLELSLAKLRREIRVRRNAKGGPQKDVAIKDVLDPLKNPTDTWMTLSSEETEAVFRHVDTDRDGTITDEELQKAIQTFSTYAEERRRLFGDEGEATAGQRKRVQRKPVLGRWCPWCCSWHAILILLIGWIAHGIIEGILEVAEDEIVPA